MKLGYKLRELICVVLGHKWRIQGGFNNERDLLMDCSQHVVCWTYCQRCHLYHGIIDPAYFYERFAIINKRRE